MDYQTKNELIALGFGLAIGFLSGIMVTIVTLSMNGVI